MNKIFYASLFFLLTATFYLFAILLNKNLGIIFFSQFLDMLAGYILLGFGMGFPIVLLAGSLSWLQILLLLGGQIDPHLAQAGLTRVLRTFVSKF